MECIVKRFEQKFLYGSEKKKHKIIHTVMISWHKENYAKGSGRVPFFVGENHADHNEGDRGR